MRYHQRQRRELEAAYLEYSSSAETKENLVPPLKAYVEYVMRYKLRDKHQAMEARVVEKVLFSLGLLKERSSFIAYVNSCINNACIDEQRRLAALKVDQIVGSITYDGGFMSLERRIDLYRAVDALPPAERALIKLNLSGYTQEEIAEKVKISQQMVSLELQRITEKLIQMLKGRRE